MRSITLRPGALSIEASACQRAGVCPDCHRPSEHVHSYDTRTVADRPCVGRGVTLHLHVRTFRCSNDRCPRRVFSERFPE